MANKRIITEAQKLPQKALKENKVFSYPICTIKAHTRPSSRPRAPKKEAGL